ANGPTRTSSARRAAGSMTAVGWTRDGKCMRAPRRREGNLGAYRGTPGPPGDGGRRILRYFAEAHQRSLATAEVNPFRDASQKRPEPSARIDPFSPRMVAYPPMLRHPHVGRPREGEPTMLTT